MSGSRGAVTGDGRRRPTRTRRGAVSRESRSNIDSLMVILGQPDYNRRVHLHLPKNRTPSGWPPKAFLASDKE
jgi:hypothetical protein